MAEPTPPAKIGVAEVSDEDGEEEALIRNGRGIHQPRKLTPEKEEPGPGCGSGGQLLLKIAVLVFLPCAGYMLGRRAGRLEAPGPDEGRDRDAGRAAGPGVGALGARGVRGTPGPSGSDAGRDRGAGRAGHPPAAAPAERGVRGALASGLAALRRAKAELLAYYGGNEPLLRAAAAKAPEADGVLSARMALKLAGMKQPGEAESDAFIIGVMGSSVSAGHDSYYEAAWPHVMEGRLAPVWEAFGKRLEVRNRGRGEARPYHASFCVRQAVGDDVDVFIRESVWRFDDGFGKSGVDFISWMKNGSEPGAAACEIILRGALQLQKQPAVQFVQVNPKGEAAKGFGYVTRFFSHGGLLGAYEGFSINAFDPFGPPFDLFPERAMQRRSKPSWSLNGTTYLPGMPCHDRGIDKCPVFPGYQDGYHNSSLKMLELHQQHPEWLRDLREQDNLFVNWHPGALGHEVMGNFMAYYYMVVMEIAAQKALATVGNSTAVSALLLEAAPAALPEPVQCAEPACNSIFQHQCATTELPKQEGPDVGDLMVNDSGHDATAVATTQVRARTFNCLVAKGEGPRNWQTARACSYKDLKLAVAAWSTKPLTLRFTDMYFCVIVIGDGPSGFTRSGSSAQWHRELEFRVNGKLCAPPDCTVSSFGLIQKVIVDARAIVGPACRRQNVEVSIAVKPLAPLGHNCSRDSMKQCSLEKGEANLWEGYKSQDFCKVMFGDCTATPRYKDPTDVKVFITHALAF